MPIFHAKLFQENEKLLNGNLQIIACAGSGKTEFVSERIAYQIYCGIAKPEQMVAFTFTEKAAEELKYRIRSKIISLMGRQTDIGDMYIGTIHAFAFKILQDYIPKYRAFDMLDEVSRLSFLSSIKWDLKAKALFDFLSEKFTYNSFVQGKKEHWTFKTFIRDVDLLREEGLSFKNAESAAFRHAAEIYFAKLEEKRFLDFSSILKIASDTLEKDAAVRGKVQKQFQFFTVDEYQDVNPIQEKLIQLISNKQNVCVVGDDDQSIYQWRGADVQNIITFGKRYKNVTVHHLDTNRRSTDGIVRTADLLIQRNNPNRLQKSVNDKGEKYQAGDLYKVVFTTQEEEIRWIVEKVKKLVGTEIVENGQARKLRYSDMAFLFRSVGNQASPYISGLQSAGIPVLYKGLGGLFETEEVRIIIQILEYIAEFDKETVYDDNCIQRLHEKLPNQFAITLRNLKAGLKQIKEHAKTQRRLSLQGLYIEILSCLGLEGNSVHDQKDDILLYNLGRFSQAISDYEGTKEYHNFNSIKDFLWFIILHGKNAYDSGKPDGLDNLIDAVQVITMHGTKGLGFPVLFIPGHFKRSRVPEFGPTFLDIHKFEHKRFLNHDADERRLYYVAMTRAKKYLFLSSAQYKINGKRVSEHSAFFDEISSKYCLTEPIKDPTKRVPCTVDGISEEIRFSTSFSELSYYLHCGYDYKMRFMFGFNPELVPAIGFGKQVHNIINVLHKEFEDTGKIPSLGKVQRVIDEHFYMRYASDAISMQLKAGAFNSLSKYIQLWEKDFSLSLKTERPFELELGNALISGSIDMIKREEGNEKVLEVVDFKTGKPCNIPPEQYALQVQLYTIAAKEALGINTQNAHIHFIDAAQSERVNVDTTPDALLATKKTIGDAVSGIMKSDFRRNPKSSKSCVSCDWCKLCPKRN